MWKVGDRLLHRFNRKLGPGVVSAVQGRRLTVEFPERGETLLLATGDQALTPLSIEAGKRARLGAGGEIVGVAAVREEGSALLADGREVPVASLWPLAEAEPLLDRLARGEVDATEDFLNRLDGLRLSRLRQADGLGAFLGGRIRLFPHQLYAAERACRGLPVRWLLADEVGLGKTVEACLIMNRLLHAGMAERTLVVAPETLILQWLGELWRKHHHVFALLDGKRLDDVVKDYGPGFNPFDVHRRAIVGLETLVERRRLTEQAVAAGIDLLVVDEAHHLRRPPGHPGDPAYRAVAPLAAASRHALLLTATPLEDDAHGFLRLLQLLRPEELPEEETFADRLARREPLPAATSATRRADIGGLPPRRAVPVELADPSAEAGWQALRALEDHLRALPAPHAAAARRKAERAFRALASPAALLAVLEREDEAGRELAAKARSADPRVAWLVEQAAAWRRAGEKTLVFVAHQESLDLLKQAIEQQAAARVGVFHEGLSPERRDIEVAQFRLTEGPSLLVSTEAGGEGRNFQFCHRLVLFDLPWRPGVVEQRIGRLDRIGRTLPTEILYFRPPSGLGRAVVEVMERIGLFEHPLGGLERELKRVTEAIEQAAVEDAGEIEAGRFLPALEAAQSGFDRERNAAWHELHRDPYRAEMGPGILARVPPDLETLTQDVVLRALARFGFTVEAQSGKSTWLIEFGPEALVDHLPGVSPGASFLGTFDREEAVEKETLDFFASGHPLIEGILSELEDGERGRVALLQAVADEEAFGLLALYRRGAEIEAVAIDAQGRRRDDLAARLMAAGLEVELVETRKWTQQAAWGKTIRRLAAALPAGEEPHALAAFRLRRR